MSKPETSSSPALPCGDGREPSNDLVTQLRFSATTFRAAGELDDTNGELAEWFRPGYLREVAKLIDQACDALVASRDTRDAGAVEPSAWMVVDNTGHRILRPFNFEAQARGEASEMDRLYPSLAPCAVVPLYDLTPAASPGRAGTDQEPQ